MYDLYITNKEKNKIKLDLGFWIQGNFSLGKWRCFGQWGRMSLGGEGYKVEEITGCEQGQIVREMKSRHKEEVSIGQGWL